LERLFRQWTPERKIKKNFLARIILQGAIRGSVLTALHSRRKLRERQAPLLSPATIFPKFGGMINSKKKLKNSDCEKSNKFLAFFNTASYK
jgi:hypothetical protein